MEVFFHARNIATAPDNEFSEIEDKYIWEEFIGENQILKQFINSVPRIAFSVLVIVIGVALIRGKKKDLSGEKEDI